MLWSKHFKKSFQGLILLNSLIKCVIWNNGMGKPRFTPWSMFTWSYIQTRADGMVGNFQEQLQRLFSFSKNLNPENILFLKKQAKENKRTIGLISKYKKHWCFWGKCMFLNQTYNNRKWNYIIRLTNLLKSFYIMIEDHYDSILRFYF